MIEEAKPYTIRLTDSEVDGIKKITMVDAVAPAVVAIVRRAIIAHKNAGEQS